jgi:hypothetical protein
MSLIPDNAICLKCNGIIPCGSLGRRLKSRCKCEDDEQLTETQGDPFLKAKRRAA